MGGAAVVLTALVGVAYWLFRMFSERWLQLKFDERLEKLRHDQNQEIKRLKFRINALMDRATKLHEREYHVLPGLWEALATAWGEVAAYTSSVQSFADVGRMSDGQLEEYLARTELYDSQKQKIKDSSDRTKTFQQEIYWHRKAEVRNHVRNFSRSLRFSGIFVPDEIKTPMDTAAAIIWEAVEEHEFNEEHERRPRERKAHTRLNDEGKKLLDTIEKAVQDRLWSISKLD